VTDGYVPVAEFLARVEHSTAAHRPDFGRPSRVSASFPPPAVSIEVGLGRQCPMRK